MRHDSDWVHYYIMFINMNDGMNGVQSHDFANQYQWICVAD